MKNLSKKQKIISIIAVIFLLIAVWFTWQMLTSELVVGKDGASLGGPGEPIY